MNPDDYLIRLECGCGAKLQTRTFSTQARAEVASQFWNEHVCPQRQNVLPPIPSSAQLVREYEYAGYDVATGTPILTHRHEDEAPHCACGHSFRSHVSPSGACEGWHDDKKCRCPRFYT